MEKLSTAKVAQVLADAAGALKDLAAERDKLAEENSSMKMRMEAEKLATAMHAKGCRLDVEHGELVSEIEKAAEDGRLPALQEAVDMVAPNMGLAGLTTSDDAPGGGMTSLEGYIIGNVG